MKFYDFAVIFFTIATILHHVDLYFEMRCEVAEVEYESKNENRFLHYLYFCIFVSICACLLYFCFGSGLDILLVFLSSSLVRLNAVKKMFGLSQAEAQY
ncbi:MAG: hypothetical protein R3Y53_07160 [Bacillota bacterium]